jgi:CBS domain containing-hemolysin-like protein
MIPLSLFLVACALVYVGTVQAAFTGMMRLSLRIMAERTSGHEALQGFLEEPSRLFVPARLLVGLLLSLTAGLVALKVGGIGPRAIGIVALAVMGYVLLCECLLPWLIVRRDPQRVLEVLLPSFSALATLLVPLTSLVGGTAETRAAGASDADGPVGEPATGEAAPEPTSPMHADERRLLRSIVDFSDRLVREVMTPRPDIVAIRADSRLDELRTFFIDQEYSRIPVYKDDLDNVLGFVFVKDLMTHREQPGDTPITSLMRPAYFVPETKRVPELLREFQRRQVQLAVVVDEYGGTAGLVSLEDLLEELVGEIRDEYDVEAEPVIEEGDGWFVFSGKVGVDVLADRLAVEIEREGFETVGGYLLARLGRVPSVGEVLEVDDLAVEILEAERRRVHRVRARRRLPVPQEDA